MRARSAAGVGAVNLADGQKWRPLAWPAILTVAKLEAVPFRDHADRFFLVASRASVGRLFCFKWSILCQGFEGIVVERFHVIGPPGFAASRKHSSHIFVAAALSASSACM